ncbi:MAG: hypothetical protein DLM73_06255, partial [Chthoniobacterales bacterium]
MEGFFVCLGILVVVVPIALLIIGAIELHKLKSAVRHLVRRVGELESRAGGFSERPPAPDAMPMPSAPFAAP